MTLLFHTGEVVFEAKPFTVYAVDTEEIVSEWHGKDLAETFRAAVDGTADPDWRAFAPLADAMDLPAARKARPSEDQAIAMVDRALNHTRGGKAWRFKNKTAQWAVLVAFSQLARSPYVAACRGSWPYHVRVAGSIPVSFYAVASGNAEAFTLSHFFSEDDVRSAYNAAMSDQSLRAVNNVSLVLNSVTPWWLGFTEALAGQAFEPFVLNVLNGEVYGFEDQTGMLLGVVASALSATDPGKGARGRLSAGDFDLTCELSRIDL